MSSLREEIIKSSPILLASGRTRDLIGPKIVNVVATADVGFNPRLDSIERVEGVQIIYEPDQLPGAIISFTLPEKAKATILLFSSGKIVCVGLDRKDINNAIRHIIKMIS